MQILALTNGQISTEWLYRKAELERRGHSVAFLRSDARMDHIASELARGYDLVISNGLRVVLDEPGLFKTQNLLVLIDHYEEHEVLPKGFAINVTPLFENDQWHVAVADPKVGELFQKQGISLDEVWLVPPGLDHRLFATPAKAKFPWHKMPDALYVLSAQGDEKLKEPERFIEFAKETYHHCQSHQDIDIEFLVPIKSVRLPYGTLWKENVLYFKWLRPKQMPALYEFVDVVLHKSPTSLAPQMVTEALAAGKPVVTTNPGRLQLLQLKQLKRLRELLIRWRRLSLGDFQREFGDSTKHILGERPPLDGHLVHCLGASDRLLDVLIRLRDEAKRTALGARAAVWAKEWPTWGESVEAMLAAAEVETAVNPAVTR